MNLNDKYKNNLIILYNSRDEDFKTYFYLIRSLKYFKILDINKKY